MVSQKRFLSLSILLSLIVLGFALCLHNLAGEQIILRDEAWYAFATNGALTRLSQALPLDLRGVLRLDYSSNGLDSYERASSNVVSGKPIFVGLLSALTWFWGSFSMIPLVGLAVAAALLAIPAMYIAARRIGLNWTSALIASIILTTSPLHVMLSRMNFVHSLLILWCTLGIIAYASSLADLHSKSKILLTGVIFGLGLASDPSFIIFYVSIGIIGILFSVYSFRTRQQTLGLRHCVFLGVGMLLPALLLELAYRLGHFVLPQVGVFSVTGSYLLDLWHHGSEAAGLGARQSADLLLYVIRAASSSAYQPAGLLFYPSVLLGFEGVVTIGLMLVGLWRIVRARRVQTAFVALLFVFALLLATLAPFKVGRSIAAILPLVVLLAAAGFEEINDRIRGWRSNPMRGAVLASILLVLVGCNLVADSKILSLRSGWPAAAAFLTDQPAARVIVNEVSDNAILAFYLRRSVVLTSDVHDLKPSDFYLTVGNYRPAGWENFTLQTADKVFENYPRVSRPLSAIGGKWLLVPWWAFDSPYPQSFKPGDDLLMLYRIP